MTLWSVHTLVDLEDCDRPLAFQKCGANHLVHHIGAHTTKKHAPPATIEERPMHTRDPQSGGVLVPQAQANGGGRGHMVDDQDAGWRGGSVGPHTHGNTSRCVVHGFSAHGSGQQEP